MASVFKSRLAPYGALLIRDCQRRMSTIREVKIPVPWGHIAGRESGPQDGKPLLMLHGWLDNCGTFDTIQPYLPKSYRCINIDIPGHGLSSHIPAGMTYCMFECLIFIRLVRDHFGWSRFSLLGHSMGSAMCVLYAGTFPEDVEALVILDLAKMLTRPAVQHPDISRDSVLAFMDTQRKLATGQQPQYAYEELRRRCAAGLELESHLDAVDALLVRGARRDPATGLYRFTYDLRFRVRALHPSTMDQWAAYAGRLRCRLLLVLTEPGAPWVDEREQAAAVDVYRRAVAELRVHRITGGHHVHLTHAERVLPLVNAFWTTLSRHQGLPPTQSCLLRVAAHCSAGWRPRALRLRCAGWGLCGRGWVPRAPLLAEQS